MQKNKEEKKPLETMTHKYEPAINTILKPFDLK